MFGPPRKNIGRRKAEFEDPLVLDNTRVASWQVHARVALQLYAGSGDLGDSGAVGCSHTNTNARTNSRLYEKTHAMCLANTTRTIARLQCFTLVVSDNDDTPIESGTRTPAETQDTSVRSFSETREEIGANYSLSPSSLPCFDAVKLFRLILKLLPEFPLF